MILFCCPFDESSSDGFYQRIRDIDQLFIDQTRIYLKLSSKIEDWSIIKLSHGRYQLQIHPNHFKEAELLNFLKEKVSLIYSHSIYSFKNIRDIYSSEARLPPLLLDFHGVVPEENSYIGKIDSALELAKIEMEAVQLAKAFIFVSIEMSKYLNKKYNLKTKEQYILTTSGNKLKAICEADLVAKINLYENDKTCLYAGGNQKWQLCHKIIDLIKQSSNNVKFEIFTPETEYFNEQLFNIKDTKVQSLPNVEVILKMKKSHFSFILREDHLLNKVSCPTKLSEALSQGLLPIFISSEIGDAQSMNIKYLHYDKFLAGELPSVYEFEELIRHNLSKWRESNEKNSLVKAQLISSYKNHTTLGDISRLKEIIISIKKEYVMNEIRHLFYFNPKRLFKVTRSFLKPSSLNSSKPGSSN